MPRIEFTIPTLRRILTLLREEVARSAPNNANAQREMDEFSQIADKLDDAYQSLSMIGGRRRRRNRRSTRKNRKSRKGRKASRRS